MAEIRCPHCGEVFQVDETEYAEIARQVRDAEFQRELAAREGAQRIHLVIGDASAASDEENQQYEKYEPAAPSRARFLFFFIYIFDGFRVLVLFCAVLQDDHPVTPRLRAASAARARHILVSRRYSETR